MSTPISATVTLSCQNGPVNQSMKASGQWSQSVSEAHPDTMSVPTTAGGTAIDYGPLSAANIGRCQFRNLDTTNYVDIGIVVAATFYPVLRLYPNTADGQNERDQQVEVTPGVQLYALANVAACEIQYLLLGKT